MRGDSGSMRRPLWRRSSEALAVVDAEFRIRTVNRSFCSLFHVDSREMEGKSFFGQGPGQSSASVLRERVREVLAKGKEISAFEIDQEFPEIGRRRLVLNARRIASTQTILIAIEDVTARVHAREELERSEGSMRALLNSVSQAVITVQEDGTIVTVNGNTEKMFGYMRQQLIGRPANLLMPESRREKRADQKDFFISHPDQPMGLSRLFEGRRSDGSTFPVDIGLSTIESNGRRLRVAFVADITQRRQLERAAQAHAEQVQALAARLLTAQEEERRRVSRELHDQICQQLASLAIEISGLRPIRRRRRKRRRC